MTPEGPLSDVRVIEVGQYGAAPYCGMQLADLGADVVKVERPDGGDPVRAMGPFMDGESSIFQHLNRNKRSVVLDLKSPEGRQVFKELVKTADIVVENLRPGTMKRLGLAYGDLRPENERLIYVAISGWGQDGPLAHQTGLDIMAQARSGLMSITGEPNGGPVKVGVPICDLLTGLYSVLGVVAALHARQSTGSGQFLDVCLFEAGVSVSVWEAARYFATGEIPKPLGSVHQGNAPYQAIRTADGWVAIGATSKTTWSSFCRVLGLGTVETDERYLDTFLRFLNRESLIPAIEAITMTKPTDHWIAVLDEAAVPCAPIQNYDQVYHDPHLLARDYFWNAPHRTLGRVSQLGSPLRFSDTKVRRGNAAPLLGADSEDVLGELGYSEAQARILSELTSAAIP